MEKSAAFERTVPTQGLDLKWGWTYLLHPKPTSIFGQPNHHRDFQLVVYLHFNKPVSGPGVYTIKAKNIYATRQHGNPLWVGSIVQDIPPLYETLQPTNRKLSKDTIVMNILSRLRKCKKSAIEQLIGQMHFPRKNYVFALHQAPFASFKPNYDARRMLRYYVRKRRALAKIYKNKRMALSGLRNPGTSTNGSQRPAIPREMHHIIAQHAVRQYAENMYHPGRSLTMWYVPK